MFSFQCPSSGQRPENITQDSIGLFSCLLNVVLKLKAASVTDFMVGPGILGCCLQGVSCLSLHAFPCPPFSSLTRSPSLQSFIPSLLPFPKHTQTLPQRLALPGVWTVWWESKRVWLCVLRQSKSGLGREARVKESWEEQAGGSAQLGRPRWTASLGGSSLKSSLRRMRMDKEEAELWVPV